jgi:signal transduction histidine kinase
VHRTRRLTIATVVFGAATIATLIVAPSLRFAYESSTLRASIDATQSVIAATAAYLVFGRVRRFHLRNDLAIVFSLALAATTNVFFAVMPDDGLNALTFQTWGRLLTRLLSTGALAYAAIAKDKPLRRPDRAGIGVIIAFDLALAVVAVIVASLVHWLPPGVEVTVADGRAEPLLWGHPALVFGEIDICLLYLLAAAGFARRADRRHDPLMTSLAVGSVLAGFSWLHFAAYPSIFNEIVQVGDGLRIAFYLVLVAGALREVQTWWTDVGRVAVLDERRRLARDLHDGLAQELAFIVRHSRLMTRNDAPPDAAEMVAGAAERALDEARRAISALTSDADEPVDLAIAHAAEEVACRDWTQVRLDVVPGIEVAPATREAILRIVRESVTNAGRHGNATLVRVKLDQDRVLSIEDDGTGFDIDEARRKGRFGLISMQERAEGLGARFKVVSRPGDGTKVEVGLP